MKQKTQSKFIGENKIALENPMIKKIETQEIQQHIPNNNFSDEMQNYPNNNIEYHQNYQNYQNYGNQPQNYSISNENYVNNLRNPVYFHPQNNIPNQQPQFFNPNINMMQYQTNFQPNYNPY